MPHYHALYLSPHLDDAVLSCGGQIAQQTAAGLPVLIVTLMAGDPPARPLSAFAQKLHDRWQLDAATAVAARRAEDTAACDLLRADLQHWDIPDCIYRADPATGTALYNDGGAIFGSVHPADKQLAAELALAWRNCPRPKPFTSPPRLAIMRPPTHPPCGRVMADQHAHLLLRRLPPMLGGRGW
ncbi:MAG: PIG-L family deacetylase [Chloroflexi bacterium]|nr:PIG-L family deacetylase [Chloroflexota bacterium]